MNENEESFAGPLDNTPCYVVSQDLASPEENPKKTVIYGPDTKINCGGWIATHVNNEKYPQYVGSMMQVVTAEFAAGLSKDANFIESEGMPFPVNPLDNIDPFGMTAEEEMQLINDLAQAKFEANMWRELWQKTADTLMREITKKGL